MQVNPVLLDIFERSQRPEKFGFIRTADVESWDLGNNDFTIDFWIYMPTGNRHHIAVTRAASGEQHVFTDGVKGDLNCDPLMFVDSMLQKSPANELRVSKGIVRYNSDFTPER